MRPLTANLPKPMLPVAGRPLLEWTVAGLRDVGVSDVHVLIGYSSKAIREHFGDGSAFGVRITYHHQERQLGTAHAVGIVKGAMDVPFLCLSGDVLLGRAGLEALVRRHDEGGTPVMGLARVKDPSRYGVVTVRDGEVASIAEKPSAPAADTVNAGSYVLTPGIFGFIERTPLSTRGEYELTDSLQMLAERDGLPVADLGPEWHDVARPWDLLAVNEWLMSRLTPRNDGDVESGAHLGDGAIVEKGATVKAGSYIEGKVMVCAGATVGPNSYLRGSTVIGPGCKVGAASEIKNSILMAHSNAPHHNYVGDSVIGRDVNLGSGTKVANLRLDGREIRVRDGDAWVETGRRKLGAIIGDGVKVGVNACIDCGTIVGEGSLIGPGRKVSGYLAPGSRLP
jgi:bifunctional UDP-N-acetylglucosamine pyrophosphorylase/glucosamine-1-phosphate N-acetyltransferase